MKEDIVVQQILKKIDENASKIVDFAEDIFKHPELGFKETRTSEKVFEKLKELGLETEKGMAITGVKSWLKGKQKESAATVAVLGELDAIRIPDHPNADKLTGAAHCCGHHAQLAAMYGAALVLSDADIIDEIEGNVVFFGIPSEEYGEIEYKNSLIKKGLIKYGGGKSELIRIGGFDDIDIVLNHHTRFRSKKRIGIGHGTSNGFISKIVKYTGKQAHAAGAPHEGINALNAVIIGLTALNAQRETFKDSDHVRVHPIVTRGGDLVNVIPGDTSIELLVRAKSIDAIIDANKKATRAFEAGGYAVGAKTEILDFPGYLPKIPVEPLSSFIEAAKMLVDENDIEVVEPTSHNTTSSDIGDLTHLLPVFSLSTGGVLGAEHSAEFKVEDPYTAYVLPAKMMALAVYDLLKNNAQKAIEIKESFKPKFTKEEYIQYMDSITKSSEE
jgi:amidohydrolase